jgi:hypothetical protein
MWDRLRSWMERYAARRRRWRADARSLASLEGRNAYYEAQRRAASARAQGQSDEFMHWARVAAEIARIAPEVDLDIHVVRAVVDDELNRPGPGSR